MQSKITPLEDAGEVAHTFQMDQNTPQAEYEPNIYPIMYWAIMYGVIAAFALLILHFLADFIGILWFPIFLAGLVWGGYRKFKQDKAAWMQNQGTPSKPKSQMEEFKDAARDIAQASREMIIRQAKEDVQTVQEEAPIAENPLSEVGQEEAAPQTEEQPRPPQSPLQPLV